ncbi:MAG: hypothetical protein M3296_08335, partial [Actinomycetota bacterium]|nr:hypothetical protein [Actinomycetota bacterium]
APTEHPLAVAFGGLLSLTGGAAPRLLVGATLASFVLLVAALYRLAAASFTVLVGLLAAALLCTRFDFPFLAARGYLDVPYLALVVWAATLEVRRPRRGVPVLVLLALAGLLRPEAWLLSGAYFLWCATPAGWSQRVRLAVLAAFAPLLWTGVDAAVTGAPLFSLTHTSGLAEELGRQRGLSDVPDAMLAFLRGLDKAPVFSAGIVGLLVATLLVPRRARVPLALLLVGLATFVLVGVAGLSVISRYLLVPSLMVMVFAAVALGGWTMLREGVALRRGWALAAGLVIAYGLAFTVPRTSLRTFSEELHFRADSQAGLEGLLRRPAVRAALPCGAVSLPNHKLVPNVRWALGRGVDGVIARSDPRRRGQLRRGVAIYATGPTSFKRYGFDPDDIVNALPLPGYRFAGATRFFGAYVRC